jgi:putative membrane protein insertion efficiency factor
LRTVSVRKDNENDLVSRQLRFNKGFLHKPKKAWQGKLEEPIEKTNQRIIGHFWAGTSATMHDRHHSKRKNDSFKHFRDNIRNSFIDVSIALRTIFSIPFILIIVFYRYLISPGLPRSCNFTPTCSQYSLEAITKYGIIRGGVLAAKRIWRCRGSNPGGYDPVP